MTFTTIITNIPGYRGIYLDLSLSVSGDYSTQSQGRAVLASWMLSPLARELFMNTQIHLLFNCLLSTFVWICQRAPMLTCAKVSLPLPFSGCPLLSSLSQ